MVCACPAEWDQNRERWDVRLNARIDPINSLQLTGSNWPRMLFINNHKVSLIVSICLSLCLSPSVSVSHAEHLSVSTFRHAIYLFHLGVFKSLIKHVKEGRKAGRGV